MSRKQHALHQDTALAELVGELRVDLLGHRFPLTGVQSIGGVRRGRFTDRRSQIWLDQHIHIIWPNLLVHLGRLLRIEVVDQ